MGYNDIDIDHLARSLWPPTRPVGTGRQTGADESMERFGGYVHAEPVLETARAARLFTNPWIGEGGMSRPCPRPAHAPALAHAGEHPGRWIAPPAGKPWPIGEDGPLGRRAPDAGGRCRLFRAMLRDDEMRRSGISDRFRPLRGKNLACWCRQDQPLPCRRIA